MRFVNLKPQQRYRGGILLQVVAKIQHYIAYIFRILLKCLSFNGLRKAKKLSSR